MEQSGVVRIRRGEGEIEAKCRVITEAPQNLLSKPEPHALGLLKLQIAKVNVGELKEIGELFGGLGRLPDKL